LIKSIKSIILDMGSFFNYYFRICMNMDAFICNCL